MIGVVKVASGKPQTGRIKLNISSGTWEAKFSFGKGKQSTGSGFTGSVTEGCFRLNHSCFGDQAPVVQKVDNAIQRINHYPLDLSLIHI